MRLRYGILACGLLATALGCSGGSKNKAGSERTVSSATAQALTDGLSFEGGVVKNGPLPDASNERVTLDPGDDTLDLEPSHAVLMPLAVKNPDEDSDPVKATLLQFGDTSNHVEIARMPDDMTDASGVVHLGVQIDVGTDICHDLCKGKLQVKMLLAAMLQSGDVGQHATRNVELDCSVGGDPDKCTDTSGSGSEAPKPECTDGKKRCAGNDVQTCRGGKWSEGAPCDQQACVGGICQGECEPGTKQCLGLVPQTCDGNGSWQDGTECMARCSGGLCVSKQESDAGMPATDAGMTNLPKDAGMPHDAGHEPVKDAAMPIEAGTSCVGGAPCSFGANVCHEGVVACDANQQAICQDNGPKTNGTACGDDHVCFAGGCVACKVGAVCDTTNPCSVGTFDSCEAGPHCTMQHTAVDGTICGTDRVCSAGQCVGCVQNAACTPTADCHNGAVDCVDGPVCVDQQTNAPDGTGCSTNGGNYCQGGSCVPCHAGDPCTLSNNPCRSGVISCGVSGPSCASTGALQPDGSSCGAGQVCKTGSCVTTSWVLAVTGGDGQQKGPDETLAPVTLSVKDQNDVPVPNVVVSITTPAGAYAPATAVTNSAGVATVVPRLGRALGMYIFTVSSSAAPSVTFSATAVAPASGTVFTVVNQSHANGNDGVNGPASMAHLSYSYSVAVASDGTLYYGENCAVYKVSTAGVLTRIAGTGSCNTGGADIGAATSIPIYYAMDLALDEAHNFLYIADNANQKVRQVDLTNGTMQTYAGGGTTSSSDYGDNQLATLGVLSNVTNLSLDAAGNLYIGDSGHVRIRKVDTAQTITTYLVGTQTCPANLNLYSCPNGCGITWDSAGRAFISGYFCGGTLAGSAAYGIARVEQNGSLTLIAGNTSSSGTGENIQATSAYLPNVARMAFDKAGNLFVGVEGEHRIRRIDSATGVIATVAGDGTAGWKGDYVDQVTAPSARFYNPKDIAFDAGGNLYVADYNNFALRAIWGIGNTTAGSVALSVSGGDGQSATVDALFSPSLAVTLTSNNQPIASATVGWQALDPGSGLAGTTSATTISGVASMGGRPGLLPGDYHFTARYRDIHGVDASGSPASLTVHATAPSNGTVFTLVNTDHSSGTTSQPTPGPFARTNYATSVATGADGTIYIGEYCQVSKLSPQGVLTPLAGNGTCTLAGDGGHAIDARLYDVEGLALDESNPSNRLLYVNDRSNARIRVITLDGNPPTIDTFVGYTGGGAAPGAPNYGVPGPGTGVALGGIYGMAVDPSDRNLYLVESGRNRILRVDPAGNTSQFLVPVGNCAGTANLYSLPSYSQIVWAPGGIAYITALICGTATNSNAVYGVMQRAPNGTLTRVAGQANSPGVQTDGAAALNTYFPSMGPIVLGPGATSLYVSLYGTHQVRVINGLDGSGTVTTVAGAGGTGAYAGDYGPATAASFNQPYSLALTPSGHLVISDYYNYAYRMVW